MRCGESIKTKILADIRQIRRGELERAFSDVNDNELDELNSLLLAGLENPDQYFLTDYCSETGIECKSRAESARLSNSLTLVDPPLVLANSLSVDPSRVSEQSPPKPLLVVKFPNRAFAARKQYRVVFNEVCQTVHDLTSWQDVALALVGALVGKC